MAGISRARLLRRNIVICWRRHDVSSRWGVSRNKRPITHSQRTCELFSFLFVVYLWFSRSSWELYFWFDGRIWRSFDRCLCCFTWDVNNANEDELWSIKFHPRSKTLSDHDWTGRWKPAGNTPDPDERICCFIHETDTWYASKWVARNFGWRTSAVGPADINKRQRKKKIPVGKKLSSLFLSLKEKGAKISIVFLELDDTGCRPLSSPLVSSQSRAGRGGDDDGTCHVIPTSYPSRSWHNFRFIPTSSSLYGFPVTN